LSLTVSVLTDCNARCATCQVYERKMPTLTVDEYDRVFRSLGDSPHWVTLTGGEPTLRMDLPEIVERLVAHCQPAIITLPTNGLATERVLDQVERILAIHPGDLVVNLSLDAIGDDHDTIRGVAGNWDAALATLEGLRALREEHRNLTVGINSVLSRFNAANFDSIVDQLLELEPDSYVVEVAQQRVELLTEDGEFVTEDDDVPAVLSRLEQRLASWRGQRSGRIVRSLRSLYHGHLIDYLANPRELLPCLAGNASAHLMPDGQLWSCSVRGETLGNVRDSDLDFPAAWRSSHASRARRSIREDRCHCSMANATYLNLLAWAPTRPRLMLDLGAALGGSFKPRSDRTPSAGRGGAGRPETGAG